MIRAGLLDHPKFKRLVHFLREPVPHCLGYLACLWHVAYQQRRAFIGTTQDIALATQYQGEPERITEALWQSGNGFIDKTERGFSIHDLADHAPQYVRRRLATGQPQASQRLAPGLQDKEEDKEEEEVNTPLAPQGGIEDVDLFSSSRKALVQPSEFLEAWNLVPQFIHARGLTGKRLRYFQARSRDAEWAKVWREALTKAARLPFCLGRNDRGWRATVDWFLRPDSVTKILEGCYDGLGGKGPARPVETPDERAAKAKAIREAAARTAAAALPPAELVFKRG